jgi:hypothetical protein
MCTLSTRPLRSLAVADAVKFAYVPQWLIDDYNATMTIGDHVTLLLIDATGATRDAWRAVLGAGFADRLTHIVEALPDPGDDLADYADDDHPDQRIETVRVRSIQRIRYELDPKDADEYPDVQQTVVPGSVVIADIEMLEAWANESGYLVGFEAP